MYKRFLTNFILVVLPLVLVLTWLLIDKPGFYGDEVTHLTYLEQALHNADNARSVLGKIATLYIFNQAYPPAFYILSLPFLNLFSDVILGMRIYIGFLFISCYFIFYKLLRIHLSSEASLYGCLFLCTSNLFIVAGRFYFIEILLLLETLVFYYFILMNNKTQEKKYIYIASFVLSLGLLTKFNFVMYVSPIILFYYGSMLYKSGKVDGNIKYISLDIFRLIFFPVLISSPWYLYNIYSQGGFGALHAADFAYQIGIIQKNDTLKSFVGGLISYFDISLPTISYISLFIVIAICAISRTGVFGRNASEEHFRTKTDEDLHVNAIYFLIPLVFIVVVSTYVNYMGMPQRWNFSYAFLAMIFAMSSESLPSSPRSLLLPFLSFIYVALILNSYVFTFFPQLKTAYLLPDPLPAGPKEVMELIIKDSKERYSSKFDDFSIGVITAGGYHDVRIIDYYAKKNNFNEKWSIPSYWENPAGADIFLTSDYLIYTPKNLTSDSVNVRYKYLLDHLPESYKVCLFNIGSIKSKSGEIFIDNLDKSCLTSQAIFDLIEVGRRYDQNTPFEVFWELDRKKAELVWEGNAKPFSKYQQDYYTLLNKIEEEKGRLPPNYFSVLKARLDEFYKNSYIVLDWGNNLLLNSSFEAVTDHQVTDWLANDIHKIKIIDNNYKSHTGSKAVRITSDGATLTQSVVIDPTKIYLLKQYTMSNQPAQETNLQVLWLNNDSQLIKADITPYTVTSTWTEEKVILIPPPESKYAVVYVTVVGESSVWFDDVTLQKASKISNN